MRVLRAVEDVNEAQKSIVYRKLRNHFGGDIKGKKVALWGLAFKPETDDMREAPSLVVIDRLLADGSEVTVFDPIAIDECRRRIGGKVAYADDMYSAVEGADALLLVTEWKQFRSPDWSRIAALMSGNVVVDGRNVYDEAELREHGFVYYKIG